MHKPTAGSVIQARANARPMMTQTAAARLVGVSLKAWQAWEYGVNPMPPGLFELFLIKTGQHKVWLIVSRAHVRG